MSSIDTTLPALAVVLITLAGVWALPWSQREVAASARAFGTLGRLVVLVVRRFGSAPEIEGARASVPASAP
jgi:hypothetical protein